MCSRDRFTAGEVLDSLVAFERLLDHWECRDLLCARANAAAFEIIPSSAGERMKRMCLFTGYYQPVIDGSLTRGR